MLSRVKLSEQASQKTAANAISAATGLTLKKHLRLKTRSFRNKSMVAEAKMTEYKPNVPEKAVEKRSISGHTLHGSFPIQGLESAHQFWVERREYQVPRWRRRLISASDRLAQSLITITRPQARSLPELAFRSMAMFLKILTIVQVAETKAILMPGQMGMNVEGMISQGKGTETKEASATATTPSEATAEGKSEEKK